MSIAGCDSYLDKQPDDQLTIETVFENRTNMERWLAYIYTGIPKYYKTNLPLQWAGSPRASRRSSTRMVTGLLPSPV